MSINFARFTLPQLREFLIEEDYEPETVKPLKKLELVEFIKGESLEDKLNERYPDEELPDEDDEADFEGAELEHDIGEEKKRGVLATLRDGRPEQPTKGSPEWNDYVIKQFIEEEFAEVPVDGGSKKIKGVRCVGLRRVAQAVLGPIISSKPINQGVFYPASSVMGKEEYAKMKLAPCAWVSYEVVFNEWGMQTTWGGLADVNYVNTDPKFIPFALATAETRAEARALKKALCINIISAEELTGQDTASIMETITTADWSPDKISDAQKVCIKRMCQKLKISVYNLINCDRDSIKTGPIKFTSKDLRNDSLDSLNNESGAKVIELLNEIQQDKKKVDDSLLEI
jgi:hypothetical protein